MRKMDYGCSRIGIMWCLIKYSCDSKVQDKNTEARRRTPKNTKTLVVDLRWKEGRLTKVKEQWRGTAFLWSNQVDAAAVVGAETKVDGGGCARVLRRREVEEWRRGKGRKGKGPSALLIRRRDKRQARESRSPKMDMSQSCRLDFWRLINKSKLYMGF